MGIDRAALAALLEAEDGPVGREVRRRAENIADIARFNAAFIMHRNPDVTDAVDYEMDGTTALIGIRDEGKISRYLASKEARENVWLLPAVEAVFGDVPVKIVF